MQRYFIILLIATSQLISIACNRKKETPHQAQAGRDSVCLVLDGDTFVMSSGKKVRILGIDTPETGEKFYDEAKTFLANLILFKEVHLQYGPDSSDRYGRLLAEVVIDTINVGFNLIRAGFAELYLFEGNRKIKEKYLPALSYALDHNNGIWSLPPPKSEKYYIRIKGSHRFHRPLCRNLKDSNPSRFLRIRARKEAILLGFSPCRNCRP